MAIPTIAMVRGYCIGGGTAVAVCCDLRICTENAKFGIPAAKLGLGYGLQRAQPLVDLVGPAYAKEMFFTGRQFDAREAENGWAWSTGWWPTMQLEPTVRRDGAHHRRQRAAHGACAKLVVGEVLKDAAGARRRPRPSAAVARMLRAATTTRKARRPSWRSASRASPAPETNRTTARAVARGSCRPLQRYSASAATRDSMSASTRL